MNTQDVIALAGQAKLRLVRFQFCDNGGIIRGKATHISGLPTRIHEGIGHGVMTAVWTGAETAGVVEGMEPVGECRLFPDPDTFTILPYVPNSASMFCDLIQLDGTPWDADPRYFLKRMIRRLANEGMQAEAAAEHEFYFARKEMDEYIPADYSLTYSTTGLDEQAEVIDAILAALETQGMGIDLYHTESGPSQQELSLRHTDVLRAADNICRARETIRGVARNFNLLATVAPKPFLDQYGSGSHMHLSLWGTEKSERRGCNLFFDSSKRGHLSQAGLYFIGGILHHVRGLVALTNGSVNSYSRLQPHSWSSAYSAWGFDNREAAVRVPSTFWGREADSINIECKFPDHSGNPYLALGGIIAAGLDGMKNHIDPGEPAEVDPGSMKEDERERRGIRRFPTSLHESLEDLERDPVLMEALGPTLSTIYLAVKRSESEYFKDKTPHEIVKQHFYKF